MLVRQLSGGQEVDLVLMVRACEPLAAVPADGDPRLRLRLGDRSGSVEALVNGEPAPQLCEPGACVRVAGHVEPQAGAVRLVVRALRAAHADEYDAAQLVDGPRLPAARMEADLRGLIATVQRLPLRTLLERVFGPQSETWPAFRDAPAAKRFHQAYRHGLLEHTLTVAQGVSAVSATFGGVDRDIAVTGALLHDVGKLDAYTPAAPAIEMTDLGKLQGEISLGYYRVRRLIEDIAGFPAELATAVLHIILSHHGQLEHGSPVLPCTREATLVHQIDNLGGRLGSFDRLEKDLPAGARWSAYDRALGGGAWFAQAA